jgi:sarcosine oxidase, subunit beta
LRSIIVIGGGITGCATACELARRGHAVRLLEARRIAAMASGWTLGGVRQSGRHPAELPLAKAAVAAWPGLSEALGHDTGYHRHGNLRLARTVAEAAAIQQLVDHQTRLGLDLRFHGGNAAVRAIAPALSGNVVAASFCPTDGYADPVAATRAYASAAEKAGAAIDEGISVQAIVARNGRVEGVDTSTGFIAADIVVVAAGIHTPRLIAPLGLPLPLDVTLVQVVQTIAEPHAFAQVFGVANADCAGRQEPSGRYRFTSGLETWAGDPEGWTEQALMPSPDAVAALRARVRHILPAAANAEVARVWGGLIDLTPDHLPVLDAPPAVRGLVVAAGFSGHGFGIAPATGRIVAELALGETPFLGVDAFRLDRFTASPAAAAPLALHG